MAFAAIAPALISGATSLIGGKMAQDGNNKAARLQQIQNAMAQERRERGLVEQKDVLRTAEGGQLANLDWGFDGSYDALLAAAMDAADNLTAGSNNSTEELRRISQANAPGMAMLREIVGNPGALTAYQRKGLEDQRKAVSDSIRGSSIAGSGRTAAALLKNVESDYNLKAQEQNRQQAVQAATLMANADNAAKGRVATNYSTLGQNLAQNASEAGSRISNIYADTGAKRAGVIGNTAGSISNAIGATTGANANTDEATGKATGAAAAANGQVASSTAGAVGAAIADAFRGSKYSNDSGAIKNTLSSGTGGLY